MKPNAIFIDNHVKDIAAVDFFTVSTVEFRILYCFGGLLAPSSLILVDSVDGKDHWTTNSRPVALSGRGPRPGTFRFRRHRKPEHSGIREQPRMRFNDLRLAEPLDRAVAAEGLPPGS